MMMGPAEAMEAAPKNSVPKNIEIIFFLVFI
jgi:hypothetical protein